LTVDSCGGKPALVAKGRNGENESAPRTLGGILYADKSKPRVFEELWVDLVRSAAASDQLAISLRSSSDSGWPCQGVAFQFFTPLLIREILFQYAPAITVKTEIRFC